MIREATLRPTGGLRAPAILSTGRTARSAPPPRITFHTFQTIVSQLTSIQNCAILSSLVHEQTRHARADARQHFVFVGAHPFGKVGCGNPIAHQQRLIACLDRVVSHVGHKLIHADPAHLRIFPPADDDLRLVRHTAEIPVGIPAWDGDDSRLCFSLPQRPVTDLPGWVRFE